MSEWIKAGFMLRLGSFLYELTMLAAVVSAVVVGFAAFILAAKAYACIRYWGKSE